MSDELFTDFVAIVMPDGSERKLSRAERHIIYSADEGKGISMRYTLADIVLLTQYLIMRGDLEKDGSLTEQGRFVVDAIRNQPRK